MSGKRNAWDYLIVTASNDAQAKAYEHQIAARRELGLLQDIGEAMVVGDPGGKRIGSGGSTVYCLTKVLNRERLKHIEWFSGTGSDERNVLGKLRILIIHAGGDSRRLPAYGPCGKIFVPVPGSSNSPLGVTLFDRILPAFSALPEGRAGEGQTVVVSGDALIQFDAKAISFAQAGATALGCYATPEAASKHGVFVAEGDGRVRIFLQKPKPAEQRTYGAIDAKGQAILDVGIMSFDAATGAALLKACEVGLNAGGEYAFSEGMNQLIMTKGLDLYREICCALGSAATVQHHLTGSRSSGSTWDEATLAKLHAAINPVPFNIQIVPTCEFLHFGTTRQLITSGLQLTKQDLGDVPADAHLSINNQIGAGGKISGPASWVEACRVNAPLTLAGQNVAVGLDVETAVNLPAGACVDVLKGFGRGGKQGWFVRCYGVTDAFKDSASEGALFCGMPILKWLEAVGMAAEEVWDSSIPAGKRSLWDAKVCPMTGKNSDFTDYLWMFDPSKASVEQKNAFKRAERYSTAEIALLTDQDAFYARRRGIMGGK